MKIISKIILFISIFFISLNGETQKYITQNIQELYYPIKVQIEREIEIQKRENSLDQRERMSAMRDIYLCNSKLYSSINEMLSNKNGC